ncbi:hypothetical protein KFL_001930060 [Klebsormidium nitens]|uniref:VWFA domain-containing protein n=1 Tax=Klebsormidium nitens TaxID=105231 RepID=A0A1Y1I8V6_KLENI|nr:hypothetical protein KFL_001930060 [Klebsormidium nitens]|eukprot:GAQ84528.1 hypothetical protein KFL_001930060 [Klebsormidium nitens]
MGLASKLKASGYGAADGSIPTAPPYQPPPPPPGYQGTPYGQPPQKVGASSAPSPAAPGSSPYPPPPGSSPYPPQPGSSPYPQAPGSSPYPPPPGASPYPPPPGASPYPPPGGSSAYPPPAGASPYPPPPGSSPYPPAGQQPGKPAQPQAGQYGAQPGAPYSGQPQTVGSQGDAGGVQAKLQSIVQTNGLHQFYPPQAIQALAQRIAQTVNFDQLAAKWRMPKELAIDLAGLGLYDIIILADDSSSMSFEEQGERIDDLKLILNKVSEVATLFDQDGIQIRFLNSQAQGNNIRTAQEAEACVAQTRFQGLTPLAASMERNILQPLVFGPAQSGQLRKPVLIVTITDGEPSDSPRDAILQVIKNARARLAQFGPKPLAFQFAQVGRDSRAQAFLGTLDKNRDVGDLIDCTSYYELEAEEFRKKGVDMTVELWLVKMMVGAIDPSYDAEDEG